MSQVLVEISSTIKKSLVQSGTPVNIQNNYKNYFGFSFRLDVTKCLHWGKIFNPEKYFAVFYDQPYTILQFSTFQLQIK